MQKIAIYDMDKTITRKATFGPFLAYAVPRHAPWRLLLVPLVAVVTLSYVAKLIDRGQLKAINLGLMMGWRIDPVRLQALSRGFAGRTLSVNVLGQALAQIQADRAAGYRIVIASASYGFYVREIAALLGISDVIATRTTEKNGQVSPTIDGENCYGPAKLSMVEDWIAEQGESAAEMRFYSDHVSDAPCLERANSAFATNPHAPLRQLAQARGWAVLDWA